MIAALLNLHIFIKVVATAATQQGREAAGAAVLQQVGSSPLLGARFPSPRAVVIRTRE